MKSIFDVSLEMEGPESGKISVGMATDMQDVLSDCFYCFAKSNDKFSSILMGVAYRLMAEHSKCNVC